MATIGILIVIFGLSSLIWGLCFRRLDKTKKVPVEALVPVVVFFGVATTFVLSLVIYAIIPFALTVAKAISKQ